MKKIILHVGAYKTATSTIQSLFTLHDEEIAARFGILYPKTFRRVNSGVSIEGMPQTDSVGHHLVAHYLHNLRSGVVTAETVDAAFRSLWEEIAASDCGAVFLASELLCFHSKPDKQFIIDRLPDFDVEVMYAVRNPVDFIESRNNQRLKSGLPLLETRRPVGFLKNIRDWERILGPGKVNVLPFATRAVTPFLRLMLATFSGPDFLAFAEARMPRTNSSISAEGVRLRRVFDCLIPAPETMSLRARHLVTRMVVDLDASLARRTTLVTLGTAERAAVQALNASQMQAICERYIDPVYQPALLEPEKGLQAERNDGGDEITLSESDMENVLTCFLELKRITRTVVTADSFRNAPIR